MANEPNFTAQLRQEARHSTTPQSTREIMLLAAEEIDRLTVLADWIERKEAARVKAE